MYPAYNKSVDFPPSHQYRDPERDYQPNQGSCEWYDPPQDRLLVNFCGDTTLHGLRYVGQARRHICERIFWFAAFCASVGTAGYLIWNMFNATRQMPIITVFSPKETPIEDIPFPAVTICNVNNIQKSKFDKIIHKGLLYLATQRQDEEANRVYAKILDMNQICKSSATFSDKVTKNDTWWGFPDKLVRWTFERRHAFEKYSNTTQTLIESSQSCKEMIMRCIWLDQIRNCSKYFQEIETDYGNCCTFNTIPMSLLLKNDSRDDEYRVKDWKDADLNYDNLLFSKETRKRRYPLRQMYPGKEAGLSVLLNPDLDEYQCTNTDSKGFMVSLSVPLDFPQIKGSGISAQTGSEVFVSVRPHLTITDSSVEKFSKEERQCYFGTEFKLPHYTKYTTTNCMNECIANRTMSKCGCLRYYMPHTEGMDPVCRPDKYDCVEEVLKDIKQQGVGRSCKPCFPTCTEIEYVAESTSLPIIEGNVKKMFKRSLFDLSFNRSLHHDASILHVYIGVDSTYARLKTENTPIPELISNAGGILGLCLGFSMLSVLEIIYYVTIRLGCNWYRDRSIKKDKANAMLLNYDAAAMAFYNNPHGYSKGQGGWSGMPHPGVSISSQAEAMNNALFTRRVGVPAPPLFRDPYGH